MTRLFAVIGSPISHSLSPVLHTAAFRARHLDALYTAVDVPRRFLRPILRALILSGVEGLNVTVPLKEAVLRLMDRVDPSALAMGAVNTIVIRHRRTIGYNTDGIGFRLALQELGWRSGPTRAVVLGAGGAARAVVWELARIAGSEVTIANRHVARARRLARSISQAHRRSTVRAVGLRGVTTAMLAQTDLLVNATTVGMRATDRPLINPALLRRRTLVYDLVYHRETALVRAARRRGCVAANGVSMLLYQGAESLRLWVKQPPPIRAMRTALVAAVKRHEERLSR